MRQKKRLFKLISAMSEEEQVALAAHALVNGVTLIGINPDADIISLQQLSIGEVDWEDLPEEHISADPEEFCKDCCISAILANLQAGRSEVKVMDELIQAAIVLIADGALL